MGFVACVNYGDFGDLIAETLYALQLSGMMEDKA